MIAPTLKVKALLIACIFFAGNSIQAQVCDNKYLSLLYQGSTYDTFTRAVNVNNETVTVGGLFDYNSPGHIAKFSANGTPIWSYQYAITYYSFYPPTFFKTVHFRDIIATRDGGYLASGNVDQVLSPFGNPPPVKKYALLAKIDKFGKVLWNKLLSNMGELSFSNIFETSDGSYIVYLATDNGRKKSPGDHSYGKILRIDASGKIKWSTQLFTYLFDAGGLGLDFKRAITQSKNNNIIIGQTVQKTAEPAANYRIHQGNLHFLELDYASGKINWETSYEYPLSPTDPNFKPDIARVDELPNGNFAFITSLYLSTPNNPLLTKKGAMVIINNKGKMQQLVAYYPSNRNACKVNEALIDKASGDATLWVKSGSEDILMNINNTGQINYSKGYNNGGGRFPMNCFTSGKKGFYILGSNFNTLYSRLLITDRVGDIDCVNVAADMVAEPADFSSFPHDSVTTSTTMNFDDYLDYGYPLERLEPYPLTKNIDCQQTTACCTDFIDSSNVNTIHICEGKTYMLPDSTVVKDSGAYYVSFKTQLGCDSIRFYHIITDKDVSKLSAGNDTCLVPPAIIKLQATAGYKDYYWNTNTLPTNEVYTITQPGNYSVTVTNSCGVKTDSITIFDQCDYDVFMPKAFTPNDDHLNDLYRIPPLNKNKLISFRIFNRWGKLVFQTTNPTEGWDGRYRNEPLPSDNFVYYLEMEGFSGKRFTDKGSFLLLR